MPRLRIKRWEKACKHYVLEGCTKTDAYKHSFKSAEGKSDDHCQQRGYELFKRPEVIARVAELMEEKAEVARKEFAVDAAYILRRLVEVDRMDIKDILDAQDQLRPVSEWPEVWRQFINQFEVEELNSGRGEDRVRIGMLKKIKWPDKLAVLKAMGTHVFVNAFKEIQEVSGPGGGPIKTITSQMTPQEAAELYAETLRAT